MSETTKHSLPPHTVPEMQEAIPFRQPSGSLMSALLEGKGENTYMPPAQDCFYSMCISTWQ